MLAVGDCSHRDHVIPTCTQPTAGLREGRKEEGEWWGMMGDNCMTGDGDKTTLTLIHIHTYTKKHALAIAHASTLSS